MAKQERLTVGGRDVVVLGTVQGFVPDAEVVLRALQEAAPAIVALGVPPEDLEALRVLDEAEAPQTLIAEVPPELKRPVRPSAGAPGVEAILGGGARGIETGQDEDAPFASLDPVQQRFLDLLSRFGEVRLPSPDLEVAFAWAREQGAAVEALDLDDESHAEVYIRANRFRDVLRSGRIQKKIMARDFEAASADELAVAWDAFQNQIPSLQKVEAAREEEMARRIREVAARGPVVAIVPVARQGGVVERLAAEG